VSATSLDPERFMSELLDWIRTRLVPNGGPIDADTALFDDGRIDSIRILELIAWTERALGRTIPDRWIRMDHFATVRRIADTFVADDATWRKEDRRAHA
jgi:acyl carrier protein